MIEISLTEYTLMKSLVYLLAFTNFGIVLSILVKKYPNWFYEED